LFEECLGGENFWRMGDLNDNKMEEEIQIWGEKGSLINTQALKLEKAGREKSAPETEADWHLLGGGKSYGVSVGMVMKRTGIFGKKMMDISNQEKDKERDKDNSFHASFCLESTEPGLITKLITLHL